MIHIIGALRAKQRVLPWLLLCLLLGNFSTAGQRLPAEAVEEFRTAVQRFESGDYKQALVLLTSLEQRFPASFDIQHLLAINLDLNGHLERANSHFRKAVELNPNSPQAGVNYGTSLMRLGRVDEALSQFRKSLQLDPGNATANFNLGTILLQQKKFQEAIPLLQKAYEVQPRVYENGYNLALCHFLLGQQSRVESILGSLRPVPAGRTEFFLLHALNQKALGNTAEAQRALTEILPSLPEHPEYHEQVAQLLFSQEMYEEALPILEQAVRKFPDSQPALENLARAELRLGRLESARRHAEAALSLGETAAAHVLLSDIREASDDPVSALTHLEAAVRLDPSEQNLFALGYQFLSHWNWNEAEQIFESALKRWPLSWRLWIGLAAVQLGQNENERATRTLLKATALEPASLLGFHLLAQSFELAEESFSPAVERFEQFYRAHPGEPWAAYYQVLSSLRKAQKNHRSVAEPESIRLLRSTLERHPDFFEAHYLLGEILFLAKNWKEAVPALRQAVKLDSGHVEARYKLALALQRNGDSEQARVEMAAYQELKKTQEEALSERISQTKQFIIELRKR